MSAKHSCACAAHEDLDTGLEAVGFKGRQRAIVRLLNLATRWALTCLASASLFLLWDTTLRLPRKPAAPQYLRVGTHNIRYDGRSSQPVPIPPVYTPPKRQSGGEFPWADRRYKVADAVLWEELDVFGAQEVLNNQVQDLQTLLGPDYSWVGVGRDDGKKAGEYVPIFYRTSRVSLLSVRHFWLSEEPNVPGSISWDAGQTRMVTLARFRFNQSSGTASAKAPSFLRWLVPEWLALRKEPAGEEFYVLNTHWDDRGLQSRTESASVIIEQVNALMEVGGGAAKDKLVILLGDLNSPASEEGYQRLTGHRTFFDVRHSLTTGLSAPFGELSTFTGFSSPPQHEVIDFVMFLDNGVVAPGNWQVTRFGVLPNEFEDQVGGLRNSDHRLVVAKLMKQDLL